MRAPRAQLVCLQFTIASKMPARSDLCILTFWVGLTVLLITSPKATGLSDTICDNIEAEWQSDEPTLEGSFPFYTLLSGSLVARPSPGPE